MTVVQETTDPELETRNGICGIYPPGCWIEVRLRDGKLESLSPDTTHPLGMVCRRGRQAAEIVYGDDADHPVPELAHEDTRRQTDSWTGRPIPVDYGTFDPVACLFHHWVISRGASGSFEWEPAYRNSSWKKNRGLWWGDGGGFGGNSSGGSEW